MSTNPVPDTYLMPRLFSSNGYTFSAIPDNPKLDSWSQYLSRREMNRGASSRWNPTPEQVQELEEMYRRGMIRPSTEQIQQIAAKLRRFGRIEGKNVFYWFQNHKARDRQKRRRQLELLGGKEALRTNQAKQSSGLSRRYLEMDQHPEKLPKMSKCRTASKEQSGNSAETRCRSLDFSSCMPHNVSNQENAFPFVAHSKLLSPKTDDSGKVESGIDENRTLELFPVRSSGLICPKEEMNGVCSLVTKLVPNQFYEFLPTKN